MRFKLFAANAVAPIEFVLNPEYLISLAGESVFTPNADRNDVVVPVFSNVTDFQIDYGGAESWISLDKVDEVYGKKLLHFSVAHSKEIKARTAHLTIGGTGVKTPAEVDFQQAQRDTVFVDGEQSLIRDLSPQDLTIVIKANVRYTYSLPSWISKVSSEKSEIDPATNLSVETLKIHMDACGGSRVSNVKFWAGRKEVGFMYIKQQNPNPTFAEIKGTQLKKDLENADWILEDPTTGKSEVLEAGMTGTELTIGGNSTKTFTEYDEVGGLGAFPALKKINMNNMYTTRFDLSDCSAITTVNASNFDAEYMDFGSLDLKDLKIYATRGNYYYGRYKDVVIKGSKIENLDAFVDSKYIPNNDQMVSLDVTGCPALKSLKTKRMYDSWSGGNSSTFKTVYVTAAQKAAIDAGTLTVDKLDSTEITVK